MIATEHPIVWVEDNSQLAQLCQSWCQHRLLAMDTEFIRTDSYYPIPALLQVFDGQNNYLIDPKAIDDWQPLAQLMVDPSVSKVFHACSEDLEVFDHLLGCLPEPLFDTQIAAAFCGYGFSVGYANLVKAVKGIELPKDETRSDWLQRPLTQAQELYAALDVELLYELAQKFMAELEQNGRLLWVQQDCQLLAANLAEQQNPDNAINRFKSAWKLDQNAYLALNELARWRELEAQKRNLPRNHVVREKALYDIVDIQPRNIGQLRKVREMSERSIRRHGEAIIDCLDFANRNTPDQFSMPKPLGSRLNKKVKAMREAVNNLAEQLDVAPEMLARKKDYEYIARAVDDGQTGLSACPAHFKDWRNEVVVPALLKAVQVNSSPSEDAAEGERN